MCRAEDCPVFSTVSISGPTKVSNATSWAEAGVGCEQRTIWHQTIERWTVKSLSIRPLPGSRGLFMFQGRLNDLG